MTIHLLRLVPFLCGIAVAAQAVLTRPHALVSGTVAYEPNTGDGYLIGSGPNDFWRHDEGVWVPVTTLHAPPTNVRIAAAWPGHGMLLCGAGQTWLFDGLDWAQIVTANAPAAPLAMAHDAARNVVVAAAAATPSPGNIQTWEFDGVVWTQRAPAFAPPSLSYNAMAWEPVAQRCALQISNGYAHGMYTWDGTNWTQHFISSGGLIGYSLATAPNQTGVLGSGGQSPINVYGLGGNGVWNINGGVALPTSGAPPVRPWSHSWFDAQRNRTVVTCVATGNRGTWYWDGQNWSQPLAGRQFPVGTQALAYDSWRGRVLAFGGYHIRGWEHDELWQRSAGQSLHLGTGATRRYRHDIAFDSWRGRLVVFGGAVFDVGGAHDNLLTVDGFATYEWDGASWHTTPGFGGAGFPNTHPKGRSGAAMAFDRQRGRTVLFGGTFLDGYPNIPDPWRNDTYEWDGSTWTRMQAATVPPVETYPHLFFDAGRGQCVLQLTGSFWGWNGIDWTQLAIPSPPSAAVVDYDAARDLYVAAVAAGVMELRGGSWQLATTARIAPVAFDTSIGRFVGVDSYGHFEFGDPAAATLRPFGDACPGSAGTPVLHGEEPPRLGTTLTLHLANVPAVALFLGVLGADAPTWLGTPLPIDLGALGMPGCALHTGIAVHELRSSPDWPIAIPSSASLLGGSFRMQAFVFDGPANAFGGVTTNAVAARVGP